MKTCILLLFFVIFFITSCDQNEYPFYDIIGPEFDFLFYHNNDVVFQFDEPVIESQFYLNNKSYNVKKIFPTANISVPITFFRTDHISVLGINTKDTFENTNLIRMSPPVYNKDPAIILFDEIRLVYTKKTKQMITLKVLRSGRTDGYNICLNLRSGKYLIPFKYKYVSKGQINRIFIDLKKSKCNDEQSICFSDTEQLLLENRLSQRSSLIYISDHMDKIIDCFFYYNSKYHELNYYETKKSFIELKDQIYSSELKIEIFDINGTTSKKTIKRKDPYFYIKND